MELCIVRDPKLGIDFGKVSKLLPYLKEKASVTTYEKLSYKTVKKINRSFTVVNIQYPFHIFKNPFFKPHIFFVLVQADKN